MITLETAKALKEAGWSKETEFCYYDFYASGDWKRIESVYCEPNSYPVVFCPSLEELLAELPITLDGVFRCSYYLTKNKLGYKAHHEIDYVSIDKDSIEISTEYCPDPAEACALLWLKLRKEGLL